MELGSTQVCFRKNTRIIMTESFDLEGSVGLSVLLPSRGRTETALNSLKSLVTKAHNIDNIEFLVALDDDDTESHEYFKDVVVPWFTDNGAKITVYVVSRFGYLQLHKYNNFLGSKSKGQWVVFWNDDAIMEDEGWDTEILSHTGKFIVQAFDTHNHHPYSIFPILPRDWIILFEELSPHQQTDAWVSQIAYLADCMVRLKTKVTHDRFDLTGNNNDKTFQEREYREGDPDDPMDINFPPTHHKKLHWAGKVVWLRKLLGQDTGFRDKWAVGEVDPWQKMKDNDPNGQIEQKAIKINEESLR